MRGWGIGLGLALAAAPAVAQFATPTVCTGTMAFLVEDGGSGTYQLDMVFDGAAYTIRARNPDNDETTEDTGTCADYLATGCRHGFPPAEGGEAGYYDFRLEARGAEGYFYTETWSDGFSGEAMLDCRPAERP